MIFVEQVANGRAAHCAAHFTSEADAVDLGGHPEDGQSIDKGRVGGPDKALVAVVRRQDVVEHAGGVLLPFVTTDAGEQLAQVQWVDL